MIAIGADAPACPYGTIAAISLPIVITYFMMNNPDYIITKAG